MGLDTGTSGEPGKRRPVRVSCRLRMPAEIGWSVVHPVVDIEISSEIVASPDFAPYLSFELIYTVAVGRHRSEQVDAMLRNEWTS